MSRPVRILLIEDDAVDRLACRRAFANHEQAIELIETDTGREGVRLARSERPDCILLDFKLPDMDGLEVLSELAGASGAPCPVVMLTGANNVSVAVEAMRRGARDYLLKDTERRYLELLPPVLARALQDQRLTEEKRQAEAALAQAHRRMTAGELAAALAHELNQPLAAITTYGEACVQLLGHARPDLGKLRRNIDEMARQAQRAGQTIRELRAFLSTGGSDRSAVDLGALARVTADLIAAEARRRGVRLALQIEEPLPPVLAAPVHIEHVLVNLLQNALEAIHAASVREGAITLSARAESDMVQVSVRDTGPGIGDAVMQRIFEPFYTTKSEGLGMGLSISRSIVEAHGGKLWVETADGAGTTFHFTLPCNR